MGELSNLNITALGTNSDLNQTLKLAHTAFQTQLWYFRVYKIQLLLIFWVSFWQFTAGAVSFYSSVRGKLSFFRCCG
jgi:hypothetical protein